MKLKGIREGMPRETSTSGVIFGRDAKLTKGERRRRGRAIRTPARGNFIGFQIRSENPWAFVLRADLFVEHVIDSLADHTRENVLAGTTADGKGQQPPLDNSTLYSDAAGTRLRAGQRSRRSLHRGYKTGFFADTIGRGKATGSTRTARAKMVTHPHRNAFLGGEFDRGHFYFYTDGDAGKVIAEAVDQVFQTAAFMPKK